MGHVHLTLTLTEKSYKRSPVFRGRLADVGRGQLTLTLTEIYAVLVAYALDLVGRRSEQQLEVKCA